MDLSQMKVGTTCTIGNNGGIDHLPTTNTFPGLKGANIVIEFFGIHFSFAFGTFHCLVLHGCDYKHQSRWLLIVIAMDTFHHVCQNKVTPKK
jgi:hypothetical protein